MAILDKSVILVSVQTTTEQAGFRNLANYSFLQATSFEW